MQNISGSLAFFYHCDKDAQLCYFFNIFLILHGGRDQSYCLHLLGMDSAVQLCSQLLLPIFIDVSIVDKRDLQGNNRFSLLCKTEVLHAVFSFSETSLEK